MRLNLDGDGVPVVCARGSESEVELECRGLVGGGEMFDEVSVDRENAE
jgi:hypothetical protein